MNTRLFLLLSLLAFIIYTFSSCGDCSRKIDCPAFADDTLTALFPYNDNQQLVFRSDTNSSQVFNLKNTRTSQPYQATSGAYGPAPRCNEEKVFESTEKDSSGRSQFGVMLQSGDYKSVDITIRTSSISFFNISDTLFSVVSINGQNAQLQYRSSLVVGNRTFNKIITATRDTSVIKTSGIYRIFHNRAEGLVGYTNYSSRINWVKQ